MPDYIDLLKSLFKSHFKCNQKMILLHIYQFYIYAKASTHRLLNFLHSKEGCRGAPQKIKDTFERQGCLKQTLSFNPSH